MGNERRKFALAGLLLLTLPGVARAQPANRPLRLALLSESTEDWAQILAVVLYGLLGLLLLTMSLVWMTAVLSGLTLQTVLGPGFAPPTAVSLRRSLRLFWPMMGLSVLQWVAGSILQSVISILYYVALLGTLINSDQLGPAIAIVAFRRSPCRRSAPG